MYQCVDLNSPKVGLVIKISPNHKMLKREISCLNSIQAQSQFSKYLYPYEYVPKVVSKGCFIHENLSVMEQIKNKKSESPTDLG